MTFEKGYLYHIFNQGNNQRKIFFNRENYIFFLKKIKTYISPYADILAWCLMPNHFHLMVYVKDVELYVDTHRFTVSQGFTPSEALTGNLHRNNQISNIKKRTFNDSIGIMLRTYTRAINKQENITGTLFRKETKAECINCQNGITPSFVKECGITIINIKNPEQQYPQICFNYIHQNPTKAKLVDKAENWEFSSANDYSGLRNGKLINKELAKEYVVF